ncbi:Heat shock factor protein 2 [Coelomomyces lativittatus]|nr:Heat shock factor protein 2 [Coelomomyces lativittatus]KAJ1510657.1 Heat shock factor protein 2 [Coelomomyces lativittatus]KAJ1516385.1 Heat shock factor protein 2 [Coelomomyces lativittatus]
MNTMQDLDFINAELKNASVWTHSWLDDTTSKLSVGPNLLKNEPRQPNWLYPLSVPSQLQEPQSKEDSKVNSFIFNLYSMLEDPNCQNFIFWLPNQSDFGFNVNAETACSVLTKYFKHHQVTSFIRQLNMYGFIKLQKKPYFIYQHPYFQKGRSDLLHLIKRNPPPFVPSYTPPILSPSIPSQTQEVQALIQRIHTLEGHLQIYQQQLQYQASLLEGLFSYN